MELDPRLLWATSGNLSSACRNPAHMADCFYRERNVEASTGTHVILAPVLTPQAAVPPGTRGAEMATLHKP